jgi:arginine decarboxylase
MTAHHAVLIANVSEVERAPDGAVPTIDPGEAGPIRHLREIHAALDERPAVELFHEAQHFLAEGQALYALGQLDLAERAAIDDLYYAISHAVRRRLSGEEKSHRSTLDELNERLVDKYFVNFSVFESVPDVWAIDQVFPIAPIARLDEAPQRRGIIADLTCDSDGQIETYVDNGELDSALPLHAPRAGESYRIGFFMVGAYQDTLGDIHNLFGDTDALNVRIDGEGYRLEPSRRGDTADVMLDYVGYDLSELRATYARQIAAIGASAEEAQRLSDLLEAGLTGYTYLEDSAAG